MEGNVPDRRQLAGKLRRSGSVARCPLVAGELRRLGRLTPQPQRRGQQRRSSALGIPTHEIHIDPSSEQSRRLDFADAEGPIASHHYAFHVSDAEFDAILQRVKAAGLAFGSGPWSLEDGKLNGWNGGRGVYFKDPNGHILELMTVPQ